MYRSIISAHSISFIREMIHCSGAGSFVTGHPLGVGIRLGEGVRVRIGSLRTCAMTASMSRVGGGLAAARTSLSTSISGNHGASDGGDFDYWTGTGTLDEATFAFLLGVLFGLLPLRLIEHSRDRSLLVPLRSRSSCTVPPSPDHRDRQSRRIQ